MLATFSLIAAIVTGLCNLPILPVVFLAIAVGSFIVDRCNDRSEAKHDAAMKATYERGMGR